MLEYIYIPDTVVIRIPGKNHLIAGGGGGGGVLLLLRLGQQAETLRVVRLLCPARVQGAELVRMGAGILCSCNVHIVKSW